ncbi:unnamed protein product [Rotaria sp. Silwood1]|nr:unnamed protein product [Rotaria sp. Silwood1]
MEIEKKQVDCIESINEKFRCDCSVDEIGENKAGIILICIRQLFQDYIKAIDNEKIILILSKCLPAIKFLNDVSSLNTIDSIFVYSSNDRLCNIDFRLNSEKHTFFNERNSLLKSIENQQIKDESKEYLLLLSKNNIIKLYHGQRICKQELEKLQNSIGNSISPNGFLSTSEDRQIALMFAGDNSLDSVLFEMKIDPLILEKPSFFF